MKDIVRTVMCVRTGAVAAVYVVMWCKRHGAYSYVCTDRKCFCSVCCLVVQGHGLLS